MEPTEEENQAKSRSDEDSINFRPSPNFKHMKKYLKVHKEEAFSSSGESNSSSGDANSSGVESNSSRGEASSSRGEASSSRGVASYSRGVASSSRGVASCSRGEASTSRGVASCSRGEASTSRGVASCSRGEASTSRGEASSSIGEAKTSFLRHKKLERVNTTMMAAAAAVQPPLPPNPPPPDTPPMIIKQEPVEDDEYNGSTIAPQTSSGVEHSTDRSVLRDAAVAIEATAAPIKTDHSEERQALTMCRNFARGTCQKGAACIFAHELILSQLPGVYTFCRNFQNSVCSFPKCKFVHATVFEKEHFFRTGILPPHTLAHLQEPVVHPPPLPPQTEETPTALPPVYADAAPGPSIPCVPAMVQYNAVVGPERMHNAVADPNIPNIFQTLQSVITTSPKREWHEIGEASTSTRVLDSAGEPHAKKCKYCDSNEIRERLMKAKVEKAARFNKELVKKIEAAYKRSSVISELIYRLLLKDCVCTHPTLNQICCWAVHLTKTSHLPWPCYCVPRSRCLRPTNCEKNLQIRLVLYIIISFIDIIISSISNLDKIIITLLFKGTVSKYRVVSAFSTSYGDTDL